VSVAHDRSGRLTVDDLYELPDDGLRHELVDGVLIVVPPPGEDHQDASYQLHRLLDDAALVAGSTVRIWEAVGVTLAEDQCLIPDLVVARPSATERRRGLRPTDVLLAVEIVSPGSRTRDRSVKPYLYAEAGIPYFWRIETASYRGRTKELPVVVAHELVGLGEYKVVATVGAGEVFRIEEPFPIAFDPASLLVV
jgi:Uma2 family endonuclease